LQFIRRSIQDKKDGDDFSPIDIDYPFFHDLQPTVISVLDAETFDLVRVAYDRINSIVRSPPKENYMAIIKAIDSAVEEL
jgi:hypothetical protein